MPMHEDFLKCSRSSVMAAYVVMLWLLTGVTSADSRWTVETLPGYAGKLPFKLETGYIGVGDLEEVQSFYYFIESERDPQNDPLMLWLTGGPGCSALSGLIFEIGPLAFNYTDIYEQDLPTFQLNPYSWTKVANIIFLDSPVGTGYSYSKTGKGYYSTTSLSTHHIYEFLRKWLLRHSEFLKNELYISGDSYSGLPVPMGYVLGNPYTNANSDCNARVKYAHRVSLISDKLYESAVLYCDGKYVNADPNNAQCQKVLHAIDDPPTSMLQWDPTNYLYSGEEIDLFHNLKRRRSDLQLDDNLPEFWCRNYNYIPIYVWTNDKNVQEALHVREGSIEQWVRCNKTLSGFTTDVNNTVPNHQRLTHKFIRALVYSGDQDLCIPYVGTLEWIKSLEVPITTNWRPWFVDGQVAGYTTKYSNSKYRLTYTTIKGGGHTAPEYKPKEALSMIDKWLARYPL
ncbi:hypothetical protein V2J09_005472 [Rumex salicifolius]